MAQTNPDSDESAGDHLYFVALPHSAWTSAVNALHRMQASSTPGSTTFRERDGLIRRLSDSLLRACHDTHETADDVTLELEATDVRYVIRALNFAWTTAEDAGATRRADALRKAAARVEEQTGLEP